VLFCKAAKICSTRQLLFQRFRFFFCFNQDVPCACASHIIFCLKFSLQFNNNIALGSAHNYLHVTRLNAPLGRFVPIVESPLQPAGSGGLQSLIPTALLRGESPDKNDQFAVTEGRQH